MCSLMGTSWHTARADGRPPAVEVVRLGPADTHRSACIRSAGDSSGCPATYRFDGGGSAPIACLELGGPQAGAARDPAARQNRAQFGPKNGGFCSPGSVLHSAPGRGAYMVALGSTVKMPMELPSVSSQMAK